jgi:hypothetical protein
MNIILKTSSQWATYIRGYIRIIVDSKCDTNFDVGNGDGGRGGNSSSRGDVDMCGCVGSSKRRRVKPKENSLTLAALGPDAAATEEAAQVYYHQSLSSLVRSQSIGNIRALLLLLMLCIGWDDLVNMVDFCSELER